MSRPRFSRIIEKLPSTVPFVGPEALERRRGATFRARIGANESVFGPSPRVIAAIRDAAPENWKYCDPDNHELKCAIAQFHGISTSNVVITEGIDGGLGLVNRLFVEPGDTVVTSDGAYPTFNFHVASCGGELIKVPYRDDHEDIGALRDAAAVHGAKILYLTNPDNPMGTWWPGCELENLISDMPPSTMLVLDEAYCDTAPADALPAIDVTNPMVMRFRTFSKAYGLAGSRLGYCLGHEDVISNFEKIRNHYGINRLAQIAGLAALLDQTYLNNIVSKISDARSGIAAIVRAHGLQPIKSATNFVTVDCLRDTGFAQDLMLALQRRDVFVRMPGVAPLNRCVRIGAGTSEDLALLEEVLPAALKAVESGVN
ncbi:MAG: pyridoxal phosphate-dependent aminotransferase [Hyphomicrobiaceae bacterium]